jgi:NAD+ synthase
LAEALGISHSIIKKAPSADLWEGQTDEGEIGIPYSTLDALLMRMIDEHRTEDELVQYGFDRTIIKKVQAMNQKNEFKRRLPIIASIMGKSNSGV